MSPGPTDSGQTEARPTPDAPAAATPVISAPAVDSARTNVSAGEQRSSGQTVVAPGVSATTTLDSTPQASSAFRAFVASMRIFGVMNGRSPRVLINGRLIRVGDVVDNQLQIVFVGIKDGQLVFKDPTGATVSRQY